MTGTSVVPQEFGAVERVRYLGREFAPDEIPDEYGDTPLGSFEVLIDGSWYRCRGSWMADGPMVWREKEPIR